MNTERLELEEALIGVLDICTGWTRKLTDAEKLAAIESLASRVLSGDSTANTDREGHEAEPNTEQTSAGDRHPSRLPSPVATPGALTGAELIAVERQRQIDAEGWTPDHDADQHDSGELVYAAISYALNPYSDERQAGAASDFSYPAGTLPPHFWPWEDECWKPTPKDRIRELTKAGALIAAEIDRLARGAGGVAPPEEPQP